MIALVPATWVLDGPTNPHWAWPDALSVVDLRNLPNQKTRGGLVGYGLCDIPDGVTPDGAEAFTGNGTRDRQMWRRVLGGNAAGDTPEELLLSHLLDNADDSGDASARPLRGKRDKVEIHFRGERQERTLTNQQRRQQEVFVRADLNRLMDQVEDGKIPQRAIRKVLRAEAERLGLDWRDVKRELVKGGARWRDIDADQPETTITDDFSGTLSAWTQVSGTWDIVGGQGGFSNPVGSDIYMRHSTPLSSSNNEARVGTVIQNSNQGFLAVLCRASAGAPVEGYAVGSFSSVPANSDGFRLKYVGGAQTFFGNTTGWLNGNTPMRVDAIGSTIRFANDLVGWDFTTTDTSITTGLYAGFAGYMHTSSSARRVDDFFASDFLPAISGVSPSSGSTAGGTAITITGTDFTGTSGVTIGGASATSVSVASATTITCVTPAGTAGAKDVVVTNGTGSGTLAGGFTYLSSGNPNTVGITRRRR